MTRPAALITGGAKRVGAALAFYLAERGYDIALHYNHSDAEAEHVKSQLRAKGVACELFQADLADTGALAMLMRKVKTTMPVTLLVNNASVFERSTFTESDEALFDRQFDINLKAPVFLTQAFAREFGKGSVINLLDTNVVKNQGSHFFYLMSKKSLTDFTLMAARQLGPEIRVNGVCPGAVLPSDQNNDDYEKKVAATNPLRSLPTVEDVCEAVYWLTTQPRITGQLLFVDGGQHAL